MPEEKLGMEAEEQPKEEEENALEAIDKATRKEPKEKDAKIDDAEILRMMMTGENKEGMVTEAEAPEKEDGVELHEKPEESPKPKGSTAESKGKYEDMFREDMFKHPNKYFVDTPQGRMTLAEAMRKGYNPLTKEFEEASSIEGIVSSASEGLNESDKATFDSLLDPANAKVAPADAEKYGLDPDSASIDRSAEAGQPQQPEAAPAIPGMPQQQQQPQQQAANQDMLAQLLQGGE